MLLPLTQVQSLAPNGVYGRRPGDNAAVDSLPDLLLIERSRGGEQRAIEALVRRYSRRLFRVARSVLVEEDAAESAVQDAYLAAFADLSRYTPTGKFAAWLTRLAFTQARAPAAGTRPGQPATPRQLAAEEPGTAEAREALERHELEKAIMALPEVFRTVLVLRTVEGISGIETAASLGVHETTVRTRMYRAQRRLGAELVQRLRLAQGLFELAPERLDRIVKRVLAQLPHGSMLTMSASPP
ncbi:MAG: sigma-70 family RNA polymerase sigma factor [Gammaproteobacteria bacterium]|nr:MAG: sigma-70 family RNA polymerase sigma factor [Gammaproteobacteria bacterium]